MRWYAAQQYAQQYRQTQSSQQYQQVQYAQQYQHASIPQQSSSVQSSGKTQYTWNTGETTYPYENASGSRTKTSAPVTSSLLNIITDNEEKTLFQRFGDYIKKRKGLFISLCVAIVLLSIFGNTGSGGVQKSGSIFQSKEEKAKTEAIAIALAEEVTLGYSYRDTGHCYADLIDDMFTGVETTVTLSGDRNSANVCFLGKVRNEPHTSMYILDGTLDFNVDIENRTCTLHPDSLYIVAIYIHNWISY